MFFKANTEKENFFSQNILNWIKFILENILRRYK